MLKGSSREQLCPFVDHKHGVRACVREGRPYRPVFRRGIPGRPWCFCVLQDSGRLGAPQLNSDSTCRTVSGERPGEKTSVRRSKVVSTQAKRGTQTTIIVAMFVDCSRHHQPKSGINAQVQDEPLTLVGRGHSSRSSVITAGPSGSSSGITRMSDCTTSSQPSSEGKTGFAVIRCLRHPKHTDTNGNVR